MKRYFSSFYYYLHLVCIFNKLLFFFNCSSENMLIVNNAICILVWYLLYDNRSSYWQTDDVRYRLTNFPAVSTISLLWVYLKGGEAKKCRVGKHALAFRC